MVFAERGKQEHPEKNLGAKERTNKKFQATHDVYAEFVPRLHWLEASAGATLALSLGTISS